jgi:glycerate kinase
VLIAPDKFKGSLTAPEVAEAVAAGMRQVRADLDLRSVPVADGGDGTVQAALTSGYQRVPALVTGPVGDPVETAFALLDGTAVLELASASGLELLDEGEFAPLGASSDGTGELISQALDTGARTIVLGVGGSACTDGGAGMLVALGARVVDESGHPLPPGGGPLSRVSTVDLSGIDERLAGTTVILASDVDNPLLGERGAARIYGPQKGADAEQVELLETGLERWSRAVLAAGGRDVAAEPGAGAAGGVGYAALAALGAQPRSGVEMVLDLVGFDAQLAGARLVITGEGALDEQTLSGKAPAGVVARARAAGVAAVAVAGRCELDQERLREAGFARAYALSEIEPDSRRSVDDAARLLETLGARIAGEQL